jgi:hypothetical protein
MTHYTIRLTFRVIGTRRTLKTFIRPEYALNTSSDATHYATVDEADAAADAVVEQMIASGRLQFIGSNLFTIS